MKFADLERERSPSVSPSTCSWNDHGRVCSYAGVVKLDGRWLCREHWDAQAGIEPKGRGNYKPQPPARSVHMRKWDGWKYNPKAKRLEREVAAAKPREPGADDDFDDLIPEEAGQA